MPHLGPLSLPVPLHWRASFRHVIFKGAYLNPNKSVRPGCESDSGNSHTGLTLESDLGPQFLHLYGTLIVPALDDI